MRVAPHTSPDLRRYWIFDRVVRVERFEPRPLSYDPYRDSDR